MLLEGTGVDLVYDSVAKTLTINSTGGGAGTDPEGVRDTIVAALRQANGISIVPDDPGDTITIGLTAIATSQVTNLDTTLADLQDQINSKADSGTAGMAPGSVLVVRKAAGVWPARPTTRSDIICFWIGADPPPSIITTGTGGMLDNVDVRMVTP
jgi:hypothetical protein